MAVVVTAGAVETGVDGTTVLAGTGAVTGAGAMTGAKRTGADGCTTGAAAALRTTTGADS